MNREDVLRMAWEAEKFANKSAAPSGSEWWQLERDTHLAALVAVAEREACARLCDEEAVFVGSYGRKGASASNCAAAIRAREENT